jgi:GMP synthase (glutamine-hydrolysing)
MRASDKAADTRRKTALVVVHAPWEGPALIAKAAREFGFELLTIRAQDLEGCKSLEDAASKTGLNRPEQQSPSAVIVMGGPMGVYETESYPWIRSELALLEKALESEIPLLGVCLGAQMIAAAAGSKVYKGEHPEIGFGEVSLTEAAADNPPMAAALRAAAASSPEAAPGQDASAGRFTPPESPELSPGNTIPVFHWHGDTFDLPAGAVRLARSSLYENQAFSLGQHSLALQFHIEVDRATYAGWVPHLPPEVLPTDDKKTEAALDRIAAVGMAAFREWFSGLESS